MKCVFLGYSQHHKGFKCLDVSSGRVYISRDVIFDETEFPFSKLHANAGARLRAEIALLPTHLLNSPIISTGMEHMGDPGVSSPDQTNIFGENLEENGAGNHDLGEEAAGDDPEDDLAQTTTEPTSGSVPDLVLPAPENASAVPVQPTTADPAASQHRDATSPTASTGDRVRLSSPTTSLGGAAATTRDNAFSAVDPAGATGSGVASDSVASSALDQSSELHLPQQVDRPRTRLQSGIRKEKMYTDGTVKYGLFISSGEPQYLEEAINDKNWKTAMDSEYMALMKNNT